nr:Protein C14A4.8 [Haemonchus contortus]
MSRRSQKSKAGLVEDSTQEDEVPWLRMEPGSLQKRFMFVFLHIVFNVRRPPPSYFGVTPKVGMLAPQQTTTIYMTFSGRCSRIPDDLVWLYSIYQLEVWQLVGSEDVANVLHLACVFFHDSKKGRCLRRHTVRPVPELDEAGMLVDEEEYDPDLHDDQSEDLPSANEGDF